MTLQPTEVFSGDVLEFGTEVSGPKVTIWKRILPSWVLDSFSCKYKTFRCRWNPVWSGHWGSKWNYSNLVVGKQGRGRMRLVVQFANFIFQQASLSIYIWAKGNKKWSLYPNLEFKITMNPKVMQWWSRLQKYQRKTWLSCWPYSAKPTQTWSGENQPNSFWDWL